MRSPRRASSVTRLGGIVANRLQYEGLNQVHPDLAVEQPSLDTKPITKTITGTLDEVVREPGLGATGY